MGTRLFLVSQSCCDGVPPLHLCLLLVQRAPNANPDSMITDLQEYNSRKRAEHFLKATLLGSPTVSVTSPKKYAKRFRTFLSDLFVARYNSTT